MTRTTRETTAGQRYLALQREAKRTGRPTDELIQLYALECFLDRLAQSRFAENFVLKGGMLLAALGARRPTRDTLGGTLSRAVVRLHVDVNVGDPIWPEPQRIKVPRLLEGVLTVRGYPLEMVLAEKIVTAIARGHDEYSLARFP